MIKRIILYFAIVTLALFGLRYLHHEGLLRNHGYYAKYRTAFFEDQNYDVLFLGSSRAEMHYDTRAFDSLTGLNSFNLGVPGTTLREAYAIFKGYLLHHPIPKHLVYEVDYYGLSNKSKGVSKFNNFFPFLSNKNLRNELTAIYPGIRWAYYIPFYSWPMVGLKNISTSLHGWLGIPGKTDSLYYKGYFKDVIRPNLEFSPETKKYAWFHLNERTYLDSLIVLCRNNKIRLVLMTSPIFGGGYLAVSNRKQAIAQVMNIAFMNRIDYFDYSCLPFCNKRDYFIDNYHLNPKGTAAFTPWLCRAFNNKIRGKPFN